MSLNRQKKTPLKTTHYVVFDANDKTDAQTKKAKHEITYISSLAPHDTK